MGGGGGGKGGIGGKAKVYGNLRIAYRQCLSRWSITDGDAGNRGAGQPLEAPAPGKGGGGKGGQEGGQTDTAIYGLPRGSVSPVGRLLRGKGKGTQ
jgi:hypothetical protein